MNDEDYFVVEAMEKFGGSFVKALANMCRHADPINLQKIKRAWPEYWEEYTKMAAKIKQRNEES